MKKNKFGRIVNLASFAVPFKLEGEAIYAASKAAIISLTETLSKEYADYGITVNAVSPPAVPTDLIKGVPKEEMTKNIQDDFDTAMTIRDDATFMQIAANAPEVYDWYKDSFYGQIFYGGRVDTRTKELLRLRLSMTHGCAFCNKGNRVAAKKAGVTETQSTMIMNEDASCFDAKDKAVLRLADQIVLTNMNGALDERLYNELKPYFDDAEIFELGVTAGILTGMAKFLFVYDLVEKEANCPITSAAE